MRSIWRLLALLPEFKPRVVRVAAVNILLGASAALVPFLLKTLLDKVVVVINTGNTAGFSQINLYLAIIISIRLFDSVTGYLQERLSDTFFLDVAVGLRQKVFKHILRLKIDFYEENRAGEIIQKIQQGILELARWVSRVFEGMLETLVSLGFILILLWIIVPPIGLIMTIVFPLNLILARRLARNVKPIRTEWLKSIERAGGELTETLTHIATIRSFGRERYKVSRYDQWISQFRSLRTTQFRLEWRMNLVRNLLNTAAVGLSLFIVTFGAIHGTNSVGDIFLVALYIQRLVSNIIPLSRLINDTADVEGTCERLVEILDSEQIIHDRPDAQPLEEIQSVEFRNVSFTYPGKDRTILADISFRLKRGQTLALVGPSGVGKTTITKLLMRFYLPTSGTILLNDQPIESFTQDSLRNVIGTVMQDVALFNDTIEENLRFANPDALPEAVEKAAKIAHINSFVAKLADGYKTLVGERGIKLSGGEKQRVAIARALLRDPELIILDEATSSLDSESEKFVQDGLGKLLKNRTAIIIAHRLSTVMNADIILVVEDGRIAEQGTHAELLKNKALYAKLFSLQTKQAYNLR